MHPRILPKSQQIKVELAPGGKLDVQRSAILGPETLQWVADRCSKHMTLLAVTELDFDRGPCSNDEDARAIKTTILKHATQLVVVADQSQLAKKKDEVEGIAADIPQWAVWLKNKRDFLWVATDIDPVLRQKGVLVAHRHPTSDVECQESNAHKFDVTFERFADHFILAR